MLKNSQSSFPSVASLLPQLRSFALGGAFAVVSTVWLMPVPLEGHGTADEEVIEHFDEHLEDFAEEIDGMVARVDAIVQVHAKGGSVEQAREMLATMRARLLRAKQLLDEAAAERPSVF